MTRSARRGCRSARSGGCDRAGGGGAWRGRADRRGGGSCSETTDERADRTAHPRPARRALALRARRGGEAVPVRAIHVVSLDLLDDDGGKSVHDGSWGSGPLRDRQVTSEAPASTSGGRAQLRRPTPYSLTPDP